MDRNRRCRIIFPLWFSVIFRVHAVGFHSTYEHHVRLYCTAGWRGGFAGRAITSAATCSLAVAVESNNVRFHKWRALYSNTIIRRGLFDRLSSVISIIWISSLGLVARSLAPRPLRHSRSSSVRLLHRITLLLRLAENRCRKRRCPKNISFISHWGGQQGNRTLPAQRTGDDDSGAFVPPQAINLRHTASRARTLKIGQDTWE